MGLLRLGKRFGTERLEAACLRAEKLASYSFQTVKNILRRGMDRLPLEQDNSSATKPLSPHCNIRGAGYYADKETLC